MNKIDKIKELAAISFEKAERYRMLSMLNVSSDYEEKNKQSIDYAIARNEMIEAETALKTEIES